MPYKDAQKKKEYNTEYNKGWRKENREKVREIGRKSHQTHKRKRNEYIKKRREDFRERIAGRPRPTLCELCGGEGKIKFDHDHQTGQFRGWICHGCNYALGHARDSVPLLYKMIDYLNKAKNEANPAFVTPEEVRKFGIE